MRPADRRKRDLVKCEDMRLHAERARVFLGDSTTEDFLSDEMAKAAVVRCMEVVGEAARLVSEYTRRRFPEVPWKLIIGLRNILAHEYGTVDFEKLYDIVTEDVPDLLVALAPLIKQLEQEVDWRDDESE